MKELLLQSVDTSRLSEGMEVKNYRALCDLLGEPVKTGGAKQSQFKEWKRYFEFEKIPGSQKMTIVEIYNRPKEKNDKRLDGIYAKSIEVILLYELSRCKGYTAYFTKNQLWHLLGMVNKNYKKISTTELKSMDYCITDFEVNHFYQRVDSRLTRILKTALGSLQKRFVVENVEEYVIVDSRDNRRKAEDIDVRNIITLKKRAARMVGCKDEREVFLKMKTAEFYKSLNNSYSYHFGWKYVYKRYKLIFNRDIVEAEIPLVEKELQRELLNCNIVNALNESAKNNYNSRIQKGFDMPPMYVQAQSLLTDRLIKIEENDPFDTGDEVLHEKSEAVECNLLEDVGVDVELDAIFGL